MKFVQSAIPDVLIIEPQLSAELDDSYSAWSQEDFSRAGLSVDFVQDSHSRSVRGVVRGLHYQVVQPQGKLVRVVAGRIFDVAVDIRRSSPTFGRHVAADLSSDNRRMLWIPPGFAHGFYVCSEFAEMLYKQTAFYAPQFERTILWDDPELAIDWPVTEPPVLSEKDKAGLGFRQAEVFP